MNGMNATNIDSLSRNTKDKEDNMIQNADNLFEEKLPDDPSEAIKHLIQLGISLEGALMEEQKALAERDPKTFQISQDRKNRRFLRYDMAASEFRYNLDKYKGVDQDLVSQLENVQKRIKKQTQTNIDMMTDLMNNAQAKEMGINPADISKMTEK